MVRSRDRTSLATLALSLGHESSAVYTSFPSDYPFRLVVTRSEYAEWVHGQVLAIGYDNFKARAAMERDAVYMDFLHRVWSSGHALTDAETCAENDAAWRERDKRRRT